MRNGGRDIQIVFRFQGHVLIRVFRRPVPVEDNVHLVLLRILHRSAGSIGINYYLAITSYAHNHRGIRISLAEQRLVMTGCRGEVRRFFSSDGGVAIKKGGIDPAILRMKEKCEQDGCEQQYER